MAYTLCVVTIDDLDPALVFGEFMGVIKGSEDAVGTKQRCLDRESYKSLSVRSQATFSHKRDEIYDLFVAYTRSKERDYDAADRWNFLSPASAPDLLNILPELTTYWRNSVTSVWPVGRWTSCMVP